MHRVYGCHIDSKPLQSDAFFNFWILLKKLKERIGQESTALSFRRCGSRPPSGISNSPAAWCWLRWAKSGAICCKWLSAPAQPQCRSSKPLWSIQGTSNGSSCGWSQRECAQSAPTSRQVPTEWPGSGRCPEVRDSRSPTRCWASSGPTKIVWDSYGAIWTWAKIGTSSSYVLPKTFKSHENPSQPTYFHVRWKLNCPKLPSDLLCPWLILVEVFLINQLWGVLWEEVDRNKQIDSKVTVKINR